MMIKPAFYTLLLVILSLKTYAQGPTSAIETVTAKALAEDSFAELKKRGAAQSSYLTRDYQRSRATTPKPRLSEFNKEILPVLRKSCMGCHGEEHTEGNIRLDTLDPNLQKGADVSWWLEVMAVLSNGEMPPPGEAGLADDDRAMIINWLASEIQVASAVRRAEGGHSSFRRMTKYEYNYALQDILNLPWNFAKDLPPEAFSDDGFQNSSDLLHMTGNQFQTYRHIARTALLRATSLNEQPPMIHWGITMKENARLDLKKQQDQLEKKRDELKDDPAKQKAELEQLLASFQAIPRGVYYNNLKTGRSAQASWVYYGGRHANAPQNNLPGFPASFEDVVVIPRGQRVYVELGDQVPDEGMLRVRVRAYTNEILESGPPSLQLEFGWRASNEGRAVLRVSDQDQFVTATAASPEVYEFMVPLGEIYPRNSVRGVNSMGQTPNPSEYIRLVNSSVSQSDIIVDFVQISTPVYQQWPTASHESIFISSPNRGNEEVYVREVLEHFMPKAWRRAITEEEIDRKVRLFAQIRPQCNTAEMAIVEVLATILSSPNMLYITRSTGSDNSFRKTSLSDYELATRLAIFLWCSTPDSILLEVAARGELQKPEVLSAQVSRMLQDPRARRMSEHFVHQWLDLKILEFLTIDRKVRPQFDAVLKDAMLEEPVAFFYEILSKNESLLNFIHADYAMVNERLASHYGLQGVYGNAFRRVKLEGSPERGGVLTQAGLLTMNSSGRDSHPLKRGIWLLESILNDPPPPPPPAVPEIDLADPEIAKLTLKERIEDHRNHAACRSCHAKIDPWGVAFENYDALGLWRNDISGKPVDASSKLFNSQELDGIDGLKRYLLENRQDQFVRAMVYKMTTFGLGRPLTFADHSSVDRITAELRNRDDGLATLLSLIVTSDLFRTK